MFGRRSNETSTPRKPVAAQPVPLASAAKATDSATALWIGATAIVITDSIDSKTLC